MGTPDAAMCGLSGRRRRRSVSSFWARLRCSHAPGVVRTERRVLALATASPDRAERAAKAALAPAFDDALGRGRDLPGLSIRGDDGTRTHNPHLAKVVRYQLRHVPGGFPGYRLVVFGGDGVRGDVHLRLVLGEVDHPALGPEAVTQRRAALVARAVEALLHASAAPGTGHLDRLHVSDASHPRCHRP